MGKKLTNNESKVVLPSDISLSMCIPSIFKSYTMLYSIVKHSEMYKKNLNTRREEVMLNIEIM